MTLYQKVSTSAKNNEAINAITKTMIVVIITSLRDGQLILTTSALTSPIKEKNFPIPDFELISIPSNKNKKSMAGAEGIEPPTAGFGDQNSTKLSYTPTIIRVYCNTQQNPWSSRF